MALTREDYRKMSPAEVDALLDKARDQAWSAARSPSQDAAAYVAAADHQHEIEMAVYLQIGDGARS